MHICYVYHTNSITQIFYVYHTHMMYIIIHTCITKKADEEKPDYVRICACVCICVCGRLTICMTGSFHTPEGVMSHPGKSHVTQQRESCRTPDGVMSQVAMNFMTHMHELCHMCRPLTRCMGHVTYGWVVSHVNKSSQIWKSLAHVKESCHVCRRVTRRTRLSRCLYAFAMCTHNYVCITI